MSSLNQIRISLEGIAHLLTNYRLKVPVYQRSYAWERSNVTELLHDIAEALKVGAAEYFLGSVVVSTEHSGVLEVVDGQQRLATVTLIVAQIRNYFLEIGEDNRAKTLEDNFLLKQDLRTQEAIPRLTLNEIDHDFFTKSVLTRPANNKSPEIPSRASHRLLIEACQTANKHIHSVASTSKTPVDALVDYVEYLDAKAKIILVQVPDQANAFTIFETLNDRGVELAISDLLKNYLFSRSENRLAETQNSWAAMAGALTAINTDASIVEYLKHYWSARHGATRERDLYSAIRKRTSSKQSAVELARGLEIGARYYAALLSHAHELWSDYGASTRQHIETINLLRMIQVRPLLLAILDKLPVPEARRSFRMILNWGVRFLIHGGLGGGVLENKYCQLAKDIHAGKITTAKQLTAAMASVVPTDGVFETAFAAATVSQAYLARYYLRVLENQANDEGQPELVPNPNQEDVTLEHVLPLKPETHWPHFDEDTAKTFQRRIGNMVLLSKKLNSSLRNASFGKKRTALAASEYLLTAEVGETIEWNAAAITARQVRLAKLATLAWPAK